MTNFEYCRIFKALTVICAFVSCVNGLTLHCDFKMRNWSMGTAYACLSETLTDDGNSTHVQSLTGNHLSGKGNADVEAFFLNSDQLHLSRIPKGIESFFPDLAAFGWYFASLESVTNEDFRPFPQLQEIRLFSNKLRSLDGDLFVHTPKLAWIWLDGNFLQNVGFGLLDGLNNLTSAFFQSNPCIDFNGFTPAAIQELKTKLRDQCPPECAEELELINSLRKRIRDLETKIEYFSCPVVC